MNQNTNTASTLSLSSTPSAEDISRRAYEIWEAEGRPEGADLRHWLQAEQELSGRGTTSDPAVSSSAAAARSNGTSHRNGGAESRPQPTSAPANTPSPAVPGPRETKRASASPFSGAKSAPPAGSLGKRK